jgi:hypothetical protein
MPIRIAALTFVLLPLAAACSQREPVPNQPPRPRGIMVDQAVRAPVAPTPPPSALPPSNEPQLPEITVHEEPTTTTPAEQAAPDQPEKEPRNLQSELETMMGSPVTCLKPRPASQAPASVSISLSANVMPSGAVGRGEVSAPGLEPEEVSCVRSRLESLRFAQPIENAPLTVSGSITLSRGS